MAALKIRARSKQIHHALSFGARAAASGCGGRAEGSGPLPWEGSTAPSPSPHHGC